MPKSTEFSTTYAEHHPEAHRLSAGLRNALAGLDHRLARELDEVAGGKQHSEHSSWLVESAYAREDEDGHHRASDPRISTTFAIGRIAEAFEQVHHQGNTSQDEMKGDATYLAHTLMQPALDTYNNMIISGTTPEMAPHLRQRLNGLSDYGPSAFIDGDHQRIIEANDEAKAIIHDATLATDQNPGFLELAAYRLPGRPPAEISFPGNSDQLYQVIQDTASAGWSRNYALHAAAEASGQAISHHKALIEDYHANGPENAEHRDRVITVMNDMSNQAETAMTYGATNHDKPLYDLGVEKARTFRYAVDDFLEHRFLPDLHESAVLHTQAQEALVELHLNHPDHNVRASGELKVLSDRTAEALNSLPDAPRSLNRAMADMLKDHFREESHGLQGEPDPQTAYETMQLAHHKAQAVAAVAFVTAHMPGEISFERHDSYQELPSYRRAAEGQQPGDVADFLATEIPQLVQTGAESPAAEWLTSKLEEQAASAIGDAASAFQELQRQGLLWDGNPNLIYGPRTDRTWHSLTIAGQLNQILEKSSVQDCIDLAGNHPGWPAFQAKLDPSRPAGA